MARRQKPVGHLKRQRKKRKGKKVTVRYADGTSAVVKPGHFQKRKRELESPLSSKTAYQRYLRSEHWRQIRRRVLERDGYRCASCDDGRRTTLLEVHHHTYERIGDERMADLTTLCQSCHADHHAGRRLVVPPG